MWVRCREVQLPREDVNDTMEDLLEDLEDFVDLRVTGEERFAGAHLSEDGADRPHVDTGGVLTTAEQDFGSSIPEGDDLQYYVRNSGQPKMMWCLPRGCMFSKAHQRL